MFLIGVLFLISLAGALPLLLVLMRASVPELPPTRPGQRRSDLGRAGLLVLAAGLAGLGVIAGGLDPELLPLGQPISLVLLAELVVDLLAALVVLSGSAARRRRAGGAPVCGPWPGSGSPCCRWSWCSSR
jgi:hypothetical protein